MNNKYPMTKENYLELKEIYPDFVWKPQFMKVLNVVSPFIRRFPLNIDYSSEIPQDGACVFISNHTNFYDSLVCNETLKSQKYFFKLFFFDSVSCVPHLVDRVLPFRKNFHAD